MYLPSFKSLQLWEYQCTPSLPSLSSVLLTHMVTQHTTKHLNTQTTEHCLLITITMYTQSVTVSACHCWPNTRTYNWKNTTVIDYPHPHHPTHTHMILGVKFNCRNDSCCIHTIININISVLQTLKLKSCAGFAVSCTPEWCHFVGPSVMSVRLHCIHVSQC